MNMSIEILEFPLCTKNKILRIKDITKLKIEYIAGKNIIINNSNLGLKEPHKIIISNSMDRLVLLCYDDKNLYNEELTAIVTSYPRIFTNILYEKEIYNWLEKHCNEDVTLNKMLDSEIEFYKEKVFNLENELGLDRKRNKYFSTFLRFLPYKFSKSISAIHVALHRMKKIFSYPITYEEDDVICVKEEGVKWLYEKHFKRDYPKELEEYKWHLETQKNNLKFKTH